MDMTFTTLNLLEKLKEDRRTNENIAQVINTSANRKPKTEPVQLLGMIEVNYNIKPVLLKLDP